MASHPPESVGAAEAIGAALTGDAAMQTRYEFRMAVMLIGVVVLLIVAVALLVWMFGLPALGIVGLVGTVLVFAVLLAYAAGF